MTISINKINSTHMTLKPEFKLNLGDIGGSGERHKLLQIFFKVAPENVKMCQNASQLQVLQIKVGQELLVGSNRAKIYPYYSNEVVWNKKCNYSLLFYYKLYNRKQSGVYHQ